MEIPTYQVEFNKGNSFRVSIQIDDDGSYDLENSEASWKFFNKSNGQVLYEATTQNGKIVIDAGGKVIQITIPSGDIDGFSCARAYYELQIWEDANEKDKWWKGRAVIS